MTERGLIAIAEAIQALADALANKTPRKRSPSGKTLPPEDLSLEDKRSLKAWALEKEPWAVPHLRRLVDDMLMYHRTESKTKTDWLLTAKRWITNERAKYGGDKLAAKQETRPAVPEHHNKTEAELRAEIESRGDRVLDREEADARIIDILARVGKRA